ncbi:MAG: taurine catabolism dioxygenase TauD [Proteobacteria bacterium]|nr:MAG: taurine catabolism dioxygenase TauD [Pseudomonadota bacterium]
MSAAATPREPAIRTWDGAEDGLPLVVEAVARSADALRSWIASHHEWVQDRLLAHGAILFRGFEVFDAPAFERVARAVDDHLQNEYLGTSPRNALTDYVFTASELPPFYPIPQHCEMSFTAHPPHKLFFCCLVEPAAGSGETPLADFRKVLRALDPELVKRFEEKGLRIVRNYSGPGGGGRFDLWKLKRWDEMFLTTDRAAVEAKCRAEGFEPVWTAGGGLRLVSTQPIVRRHPITGEPVWHNHSTTFHVSQAAGEYARIQRLRPSLRHFALWQLARALGALQRRKPADERAMHCTWADGSEIPDADMEAVRDAVWQHLVIVPWRRGDVVAIDNFAVAHGRLPYRGPRNIAVAWA